LPQDNALMINKSSSYQHTDWR